MITKWATLPNAKHIDRIIASVNSAPDLWMSVRNYEAKPLTDGYVVRTAVAKAASRVRSQIRLTHWQAAYDAMMYLSSSITFAQRSVLCLIAYDECGYMLDSCPDELEILAAFGDEKAILLYPACKVFHLLKITD